MTSKNKSNSISDQRRRQGNKFFQRSDYFWALALYNEALCYAELNSKQLGLCYGNRSAAFLKVKQYKACLENIALARNYDLPENILSKLCERENECKRLLEMASGEQEESWNPFFKLSYEANPKLPFLANCLKLKKHKDGMFLVSNRDLKAGDIIAITEPFVQFSNNTSSYRCNYCLADKFMNFMPCSGCAEVMFCNKNCMQKALAEFHQFECGIKDNPSVHPFDTYILRTIMKCHALFNGNKEEMENFLSSNMKEKLLTPFDFDLSDPTSLASQKNIMLTQLSPNQQFSVPRMELRYYSIRPLLRRHAELYGFITMKLFLTAGAFAIGDAKKHKSITGRALSTSNQRCGGFTINYFGDAIDICSNVLRYSCAPNMILHPYNGKIVWIVHYPIKANDWLTVAFNNTVFYETTHTERLKADIGDIVARCKCPACINKWDRVIAVLAMPLGIMHCSSKKAIENFHKFSREINRMAKPLTRKCKEDVWLSINYFRWNVIQIGKASFWDRIPPMSIDPINDSLLNFQM